MTSWATGWGLARTRKVTRMRWAVYIHRGQRRVRGNMTRLIKNDRRRRTTSEWSGRGPTSNWGRWWRQMNVITVGWSTRVGPEQRARSVRCRR